MKTSYLGLSFLFMITTACCMFSTEENEKLLFDSDGGEYQQGNNEDEDFQNHSEKIIYPEGLNNLIQNIKDAQSGHIVDFDGDGEGEFQKTRMDDGSILIEMFKSNGMVYFQSMKYPNGDVETFHDTNGNGETDIAEFIYFNDIKQVYMYDRDFDGYPEEKLISQYDKMSDLIITTLMTDTSKTGEYVLIQEDTRPLYIFKIIFKKTLKFNVEVYIMVLRVLIGKIAVAQRKQPFLWDVKLPRRFFVG